MRALIVEDNPGWQEILTEILTDLGLVVDAACTPLAARSAIGAHHHRVAVVDLSLRPDDQANQEGLEILAALQQADPACTPLLLTGYATVEIAVAALKTYHAFTCLRKENFRRAEFKDIVRQILDETEAADPLAGLTAREREVMALLAQGMTNKGIAHELTISENTVKRHLKAIFAKLSVDSRAAAVAIALKVTAPRSRS